MTTPLRIINESLQERAAMKVQYIVFDMNVPVDARGGEGLIDGGSVCYPSTKFQRKSAHQMCFASGFSRSACR